MDVEQHGEQDRRPQDGREHECVGADQRQPVLQQPQHDRADQPAQDSAGAAGQRRAADHPGGDREEHQRGPARLWIDRGDAVALQDAGEAREQAHDDEVADLEPVHVDAGLAGAERVGAGGDGVQPPARVAQHDVHDRHHQQRPDDLAIAPVAEERGKPFATRRRDRGAARQRERQAVQQEHGAERGHERRHPQQHRDQAVDQPDQARRQQRQQQRGEYRDAGADREMHHERRESEGHAGGQVDLAADHQHGLATGDDGPGRDELGQVL